MARAHRGTHLVLGENTVTLAADESPGEVAKIGGPFRLTPAAGGAIVARGGGQEAWVGGRERAFEVPRLAKLGFEKAIVPRANQPKAKIAGIEVVAVERVDQAVQVLRNL